MKYFAAGSKSVSLNPGSNPGGFSETSVTRNFMLLKNNRQVFYSQGFSRILTLTYVVLLLIMGSELGTYV